MGSQDILSQLGRRLRAARERTGLSVSALARASGISRRYVTEAEAGRANPSVTTLFALAAALRIRPAELIEFGTVAAEVGRIALVGLRGAGKSSVGRKLALELEVPFIELDRRVEELAGLSLGAIFDLHGAAYFRRLEAEALEKVLSEGERLVLATSGSIVESPTTFARLRQTCCTVWLQAQAEDHHRRVAAQGDRRPMEGRPRAMQELHAILDLREPLYARCEIHVDTSGRTVDEVVADLLRHFAQ